MANRDQGEVSVQVAGVTYTLVLNLAGMIAAEEQAEAAGKAATWDEIVVRAGKGSAWASRLFVYAMFQRHHSDLSLAQVGDIIDAAGGMTGMHRALAAGQEALAPDADDVQALGKTRPRKARAVNGSGATSIAPAAAVV